MSTTERVDMGRVVEDPAVSGTRPRICGCNGDSPINNQDPNFNEKMGGDLFVSLSRMV